MQNHGDRSSSGWTPVMLRYLEEQLKATADLLNADNRIAILAGQGCLNAGEEVERLADMLGAPLAKAYAVEAEQYINDS